MDKKDIHYLINIAYNIKRYEDLCIYALNYINLIDNNEYIDINIFLYLFESAMHLINKNIKTLKCINKSSLSFIDIKKEIIYVNSIMHDLYNKYKKYNNLLMYLINIKTYEYYLIESKFNINVSKYINDMYNILFKMIHDAYFNNITNTNNNDYYYLISLPYCLIHIQDDDYNNIIDYDFNDIYTLYNVIVDQYYNIIDIDHMYNDTINIIIELSRYFHEIDYAHIKRYI